jgi:hypothetical protein
LDNTGSIITDEEFIKAAVKKGYRYYYSLVEIMSDRPSTHPLVLFQGRTDDTSLLSSDDGDDALQYNDDDDEEDTPPLPIQASAYISSLGSTLKNPRATPSAAPIESSSILTTVTASTPTAIVSSRQTQYGADPGGAFGESTSRLAKKAQTQHAN